MSDDITPENAAREGAGLPETTDNPVDELRPAYRRVYAAARRMAKEMLGERFRLLRLARNAYSKTLDEENAVRAVKRDLLTLVRLTRAWARRDYTHVSRKTLLSVVGAVLYFVSPLDAIPDFIPVVGLADDVAVVAAVVRAVRGDLERFRAWEAAQQDDTQQNDASSLPQETPGEDDTASPVGR